MADREPLCFLAAVASGQSHQWREDNRERSAANQQQSDRCFKDGRDHLAEKQHLSRSAVSSTQNQARCPVCDQGYGRQTSPLDLPHAPLRHEICGQRRGLLPNSIQTIPDQAPQVESRQPRLPSHPDTGRSLKSMSLSFWGEINCAVHSNLRDQPLLDADAGEMKSRAERVRTLYLGNLSHVPSR